MKNRIIVSVRYLLAMMLLTGLIYPFLVTGISRVVFPFRSEGSLLTADGNIIGSELIGQKFDSARYFWPRPSATDYSAVPSGASNLGPASRKLKELAAQRRREFCVKNGLDTSTVVPSEMLFTSGSGLDPHISPESAYLQAGRVADSRKFTAHQKEELLNCIKRLTEPTGLPVLGEKRVNVLLLNIETDKIKQKNPGP